jgi:hypothetical protein
LPNLALRFRGTHCRQLSSTRVQLGTDGQGTGGGRLAPSKLLPIHSPPPLCSVGQKKACDCTNDMVLAAGALQEKRNKSAHQHTYASEMPDCKLPVKCQIANSFNHTRHFQQILTKLLYSSPDTSSKPYDTALFCLQIRQHLTAAHVLEAEKAANLVACSQEISRDKDTCVWATGSFSSGFKQRERLHWWIQA